MFKIAIRALALLQCAAPEIPLFVIAAAECQDNRLGDFSFPEIVAYILAEARAAAAIIERVIHKLKRDAEVHTEGSASCLLGFRSLSQYRTDFARRGKQLGGFSTDHGEI